MTLAQRHGYVLILAFAALVQFPAFTAAQEAAKPGWSIPSDVKSELINGYRIAYKDEGQGAAIVFVHGANADYRSFGPQIAALASSYRVIAPSLRHYYPERWNGEGSDFSIEQHAADVAALIGMLDLGKVHLVGWSRGGAVAIEIAKAHPDLVRTLVMEDGVIALPVEETPERRNAAELRAKTNKAIEEHLLAGDPNKAAEVLVDALSDPGAWLRLPEPRKQVVLDNIHTVLGDKVMGPATTCDQLKKFDFPVLLMTAERSPRRYAFFYGEMKKCAAFPDPIVIPGAAHNIHGGNVDAYNKALVTFFERATR